MRINQISFSRLYGIGIQLPDMGDWKPVANNTSIQHCGEMVVVKLHRTEIATLFPHGAVMLSPDGWETVTTKQRLNALLSHTRVRITQKDFRWYIGWQCQDALTGEWHRFETRFRDGMVVRPDDTIWLGRERVI